MRAWRSSSAVVASALVAACSASTAHTPVDGGGQVSSGSGAVVFHGSISVTGGTTYKESFTDSNSGAGATSCAAAASKGTQAVTHGFLVPTPPLRDAVTVLVSLNPYKGPGTFGSGTSVSAGTLSIQGATYGLGSNAGTASVTVKPDGSGTLTFTKANNQTHASAATIDGAVTWTCSD